jgi:hypothetical protein
MRSILDAWITDIKDARKKMTASQEATEANPEKMEPNLKEKEAVLEWQEIPNEEAAIHSLRACQIEMMACQETKEARLECKGPTSVDMESEAKHKKVSKEHAAMEIVKALRKLHRGRKLAAGRCGDPKELAQRDCRSWRKLAATCRKVSRHARVA